MEAPNEYDDEPSIWTWDYDEDILLDDIDDDYILCPRCEDRDMPSSHQVCWSCRDEMWNHDNA